MSGIILVVRSGPAQININMSRAAVFRHAYIRMAPAQVLVEDDDAVAVIGRCWTIEADGSWIFWDERMIQNAW
jgi:hypothetical protein